MRKYLFLATTFVLVLGLFFTGCTQQAMTPTPKAAPAVTPGAPQPTAPAPTTPIKPAPPTQPAAGQPQAVILKGLSFQPVNAGSTKTFFVYINALNERGKGKIQIDYLGGPEIVPRADAPKAAQSGVVDLVYIPFSFYGGVVPIGDMALLIEKSGKEERAAGLWDYMRELHAKAGLYFFGRAESSTKGDFLWNSVKKITSMKDLTGQRVAGGSLAAKPFVQAVGASFVQIQIEDVFTALERGVVDSYLNPPSGQVTTGAPRICKNFIDHPLYGGNVSLFMGLNRWKELSPELQDILMKTFYDIEDKMNQSWDDNLVADRQKMVAAGEVPVKLPADEVDKYIKLAYDSVRADMLKQYPDIAPKLLGMMKK